MRPTLRPRQIKAIDDARRVIASGKRAPIIVAPTGAGKTVIASEIIRSAADKGKRVLFLAHRKELIQQAKNKLEDVGLTCGVIMAREPICLLHRVQVASVQTLVRRMDMLDFAPDLIVIDECHLSNAQSYRAVMDRYHRAILIGLTATPQRLDGTGLGVEHGGLFDSMVMAGTPEELIAEGHLVPYVYYAPQLFDASGMAVVGGEFDRRAQGEMADTSRITGDFIAHWKKLAQGRPTMVACVTLQQAYHVAEQAREAGIRAVAVEADSPDRQAVLDDLAAGRIDMGINVGLWIEGVDCPAVSCVVWLMATKSVTKFLQFIGRGFRPAPGKHDLIIIDHAGNSAIHGLPDSPREWSLEGRRKGGNADRPPPVRSCPTCFAVHVPAPTCPRCGHVYEAALNSGPVQVEGELVRITKEQIEAVKQVKKMEEREAKTLADLKKLAQIRGYKPGWAEHKFAAREAKRARYIQ